MLHYPIVDANGDFERAPLLHPLLQFPHLP